MANTEVLSEHKKQLTSRWKGLVVGIVLVVIGVVALAMPHATSSTIMILVGIASLWRGVIYLYRGIHDRQLQRGASIITAAGVVLVIIGLLFIFRVGFALDALAYIIGILYMLDAVGSISDVNALYRHNSWMAMSATALIVLTFLFGVLLLLQPALLWLTTAVLVGLGFITSGLVILLVACASYGWLASSVTDRN